MKVIILDNGLHRKGDHSYAINSALFNRLRELKVLTTIYSFEKVDEQVRADLPCIPHFKCLLYDRIDLNRIQIFLRRIAANLNLSIRISNPSERTNAIHLNRSFYKDLARLPDEIWQGDNIVLFTGIMQHQLIGMARFLRERKSFVEAKVVCQLMFDPSWLPWGALARRGTSLYRAAFRLLKPQIGKTVFFTTENEHLARVYKTRFGVKPGLLPIPLCGARECKPPDAPIQVGFFGYSKTEKGFHLLPEAIKQCLAARPDLQFRVQIQHHENEPETIAADQALRQIPTLQVFDGDLSADDFAAATAPLDVMLLPYNQTFFGTRGSGLYIESISAGRLIVAAEGIWAARGIEAGDAVGIVFSPYTSEALAHALLRLCSNFNESRALARAKAAAHARANSIEAYVEALFNITVGSTTGPQTDKPSPS